MLSVFWNGSFRMFATRFIADIYFVYNKLKLKKPSVRSNLEQIEGELSVVEVVAQPVAIPDQHFLHYPRNVRTTTCKLVQHGRITCSPASFVDSALTTAAETNCYVEADLMPALKLAVRRPYSKSFCEASPASDIGTMQQHAAECFPLA